MFLLEHSAQQKVERYHKEAEVWHLLEQKVSWRHLGSTFLRMLAERLEAPANEGGHVRVHEV